MPENLVPTILAVAGVLAALVTIAGGLYVLVVRPVRALLAVGERIETFFEDWHGSEERPGVPARPGVMVRLSAIEGELKTNHGSSLRDAVTRLEAAMARLEKAERPME